MRFAILTTAAALWVAAASVPAHAQQSYWYDGDQRRALWSESEWVADFAAPSSEKSRVLKAAGLHKQGAGPQSPVFRDASHQGSPRRALPGGVILRFAPGTSPAAREALVARYGLDPAREIGEGGDLWLIRTPPGLPALELANRLYESGDFAAASPNWWVARALK